MQLRLFAGNEQTRQMPSHRLKQCEDFRNQHRTFCDIHQPMRFRLVKSKRRTGRMPLRLEYGTSARTCCDRADRFDRRINKPPLFQCADDELTFPGKVSTMLDHLNRAPATNPKMTTD